jgi:hypothetical protein
VTLYWPVFAACIVFIACVVAGFYWHDLQRWRAARRRGDLLSDDVFRRGPRRGE